MNARYAQYLPEFVKQGIEAELLDERLGQYDLKCLGAALDANRDLKFTYLGLQILYDRYFLHVRGRRIERFCQTALLHGEETGAISQRPRFIRP